MKSYLQKIKFPFHYQILAGIILGALFGYFFHAQVFYVDWMGTLFLRALKMIVVPLVFCSVCAGVSRLSAQDDFLRLGSKTLFYYLLTSILAILTGLFFVDLFKPGVGLDSAPENFVFSSQVLELRSMLLNIIPDNVFYSFAFGEMIGIIVFAMLFGIFLGKSSHKGAQVAQNMIEGVGEVILKLTQWILKAAPIGVFGILAGVLASEAGKEGGLEEMFKSQGFYLLTILCGIAFHMFVTLSILMYATARINPWQHLRQMKDVILLAFSTASSNGTLPLTLQHIEERSHVSARIANFTLPLGATINMNGTALYEGVAVLFIAQAYGIDLDFVQQLTILFGALLVGIGSAGVPMASLVMTIMIIQMVGLPPESIGLILLVDRFADMLRTALNVYSDTVCTVIVAADDKKRGENAGACH